MSFSIEHITIGGCDICRKPIDADAPHAESEHEDRRGIQLYQATRGERNIIVAHTCCLARRLYAFRGRQFQRAHAALVAASNRSAAPTGDSTE